MLPEETSRIDLHLRHQFWRWGRIAFALAAAFLLIQLLFVARPLLDAVLSVLLLLVFAGITALVLAPLSRLLQRAHVGAGFAALVALVVGVAVVVGVVLLIALPVASQAKDLTNDLPKLERPFLELQRWLGDRGVHVGLGTVASVLGISLNKGSSGAAIANVARVTVGVLVDALIVLVFTFWLLRDYDVLQRGLLAVLPGRWRNDVDFGLRAFVVVFGGYLRGQLVLAVFVGVLSGFGCAVIGVPFPLLVGVSAGAFELIPLAGPFVGAAVGVVFALTVSPVLAAETVGVFIAIHILDGYVVSPRVQGRFVRLHPLLTVLALLIGVEAAGFLGAFFAVPVASWVAAIARAKLADLRAEQPELFTAPADTQARGRRRSLLAEYRVRPWAMLQGMGRRVSRAVKD